MKYFTFLAVLLSLFVSCKDNQRSLHSVSDDFSFDIDCSDVWTGGSSIPMENMIEDIRIVKLETSRASVLSHIRKVEVSQDYIYLLDDSSIGNVLIFDRNGNFVRRLAFGQGPQELIFAGYLYFDVKSNALFVCDTPSRRIVKYTNTGDFISNIYVNQDFREAFFVHDNNFIFVSQSFQNSANQFLVFKTDSTFQNEEVWELGAEDKTIVKHNYFCLLNDSVRIYKDNEVYVYAGDSIYKEFSVANSNISKLDKPEETLSASFDTDYIFCNTIVETVNHQWFPFISQQRLKNVFRNIKTNQLWIDAHKPHSITNLFNIENSCICCQDYFIAIIYPEQLMRNVDVGPFADYGWDGSNLGGLISPEDMEKLKSVKPDDNPIIVLFKLKSEI